MKRLIEKVFLFCVFLFAGLPAAYSQTPFLQGVTGKDGLSGTIVYAIYKDNTGLVWLATDKGVDRFDGYHVYPCAGFKGTAVKTLAGRNGGMVLAGNEAGLWEYDIPAGTFKPFFRRDVNAGVSCLLTGAHGEIYAGTTKGIFIYDNHRWRNVTIESNNLSRNNNIVNLAMGDGNRLYVVGERGVYVLNLSTYKVTRLMEGETKLFTSIAYGGRYLYIGTRNRGVIRYDVHSKEPVTLPVPNTYAIKSLQADSGQSRLYAATDGGGVFLLSISDGKLLTHLQSKAGIENTLRSNSVYSLLADRDGVLWIGYFQMGLDYTLYQNHLFSLYTFTPLFTSYHIPVRAIAIRGAQRVIGSRDGLYFIDESKKAVRHYTAPQLASNMIFSIIYYRGGYLIGTTAGLYRLNPANGDLQECKLPGTQGKDELFFSLAAGRDGSLWAGTSTGVFRFKDGRQMTGHYLTSNSQLPGNIVYNVYEDREARIWISTDNGMCLFEPSTQSLHTDLFPKSFPWKSIRNVFESASGKFYFTTTKGTLLSSSPDLKKTEDFATTLFTDGKKCMFLAEDNKRGLWIGTDNGLFCIRKNGILHSYTFRDGVVDPVFFSCIPVKDDQGSLWFGNSQGLLRWSGTYAAPSSPYKIRVTDVLVNGHSQGGKAFDSKGIKLSSSKDELTFNFSDFSYTEPSSILFEYCLEGHDTGWRQLKGKSSITFYNLSSGSYTLKLRVAGIPSSEVQIPVSVGISWWLIVLAIVAFTSIAGRILWFRFGTMWKKRLKLVFRDRPPRVSGDKPSESFDKYRNNKVDEENCILLERKLEEMMKGEKMYLNPNLKLRDVSAKIGVPVYNLSYVLNIYMHQRFNDYVNNYRVAEFKLLVKDEKYRKYTLDALSELCGFSSKTSFFRNFKRIEKITPSEYIRQLE